MILSLCRNCSWSHLLSIKTNKRKRGPAPNPRVSGLVKHSNFVFFTYFCVHTDPLLSCLGKTSPSQILSTSFTVLFLKQDILPQATRLFDLYWSIIRIWWTVSEFPGSLKPTLGIINLGLFEIAYEIFIGSAILKSWLIIKIIKCKKKS